MPLSRGLVRQFLADEGWGVIDSQDVPGGCWVGFSAVVMDGYRSLVASEAVDFTFEAADQDGYAYRAIQVWPLDKATKSTGIKNVEESNSAYESRMLINPAE